MMMSSLVAGLAAAAATATSSGAPPAVSAVGHARAFLQALAADPAAASALATPDAMIVVFDTGAPLSLFIDKIRPTMPWWTSCQVQSLALAATADGLKTAGEASLPWQKGGRLDHVTAACSCMTPGGQRTIRVGVTMKDDRVAMLSLGRS
jgi:hypothetical protein